jgi:hypothetical protein
MESPLDRPTTSPPSPMGIFNKVLLINLGIMVAYTILTSFGKDEYMAVNALLIVVHMLICLLSGLILLIPSLKQRQLAQGQLLSGVLVLLIGFGACLGKMMIIEALRT